MAVNHTISAVLNTYNAAQHLPQVLEALTGFDEIVVCDMHSTDSTVRIAEQYGSKILYHEYAAICEPARNAAIQAASSEYILVVDADEIVPTALRQHLYELIKSPNAPAAVRIPRRNYFLGRWMRCLYPDYITRFARRTAIDWPPTIHAQPVIDGHIATIHTKRPDLAFEHLADNTLSGRLQKTDLYTEREVLRRGARNYGYSALLFKPLFRFLKTYLMKGGWRDGRAGLVWAYMDAMYKFVTLAKQIEATHNNNKEEAKS